ncbi:MAG: hypothetical protein CFE37_09595 [Alphaproteobacteria bacterium PA4]|nr:MAG: hypothetical protein CFE37_09595 [Alphaproteobacteria bacterium PA4]
MRSGVDEAATPKYAHVERERRWLVALDRLPTLTGQRHVLIEDRYIDNTALRLRRMTDSTSNAVALKLTKKYAHADTRARPIVTAYLDANEYAVFTALPAHALVKRRFPIADGGVTFSVDQFLGPLAGLILAEREAVDADSLIALPTPVWALREVTDDPQFAGGTLATHGLPETLP